MIQTDSAQRTKTVLTNNPNPQMPPTALTWSPVVPWLSFTRTPRESRSSVGMLRKEQVKRFNPLADTPASPVCQRHNPAHKYCPWKSFAISAAPGSSGCYFPQLKVHPEGLRAESRVLAHSYCSSPNIGLRLLSRRNRSVVWRWERGGWEDGKLWELNSLCIRIGLGETSQWDPEDTRRVEKGEN